MAHITRNEFGAIVVNKRALIKMIVETILDMSDRFVPCNRKGKLIKSKPTPFIDPDYYDSVDLQEYKDNMEIKIYLIARFGTSPSESAEVLFDRIDKIFEMFELDKPKEVTVTFKGEIGDVIRKRNIVIKHRND